MHKSKIGCRPAALHDELNERLKNGYDGIATLAWLNALPPVQAMLDEWFQSYPINLENLLLWRKTGLPAWGNRHERLERLTTARIADRRVRSAEWKRETETCGMSAGWAGQSGGVWRWVGPYRGVSCFVGKEGKQESPKNHPTD